MKLVITEFHYAVNHVLKTSAEQRPPVDNNHSKSDPSNFSVLNQPPYNDQLSTASIGHLNLIHFLLLFSLSQFWSTKKAKKHYCRKIIIKRREINVNDVAKRISSISHTHSLSLSHTYSFLHTHFHKHSHTHTHSLSHTHSQTQTLSNSSTHPLSLSNTHYHSHTLTISILRLSYTRTYTHTLTHTLSHSYTRSYTHYLSQTNTQTRTNSLSL